MKPVFEKLLGLRMWPVLYVLFVILALNAPPDAWADAESDPAASQQTKTAP